MKKTVRILCYVLLCALTLPKSYVFAFNEQRKFIGQEYDTVTGLDYLNARYYDAKRGQFISQDPMFWNPTPEILADPQQLNSYSYARNNPIIASDPTGLIPTTKEAAIMASQIYQTGHEGDNLTGGWNYNNSLAGKDNMKMGIYSRVQDSGNLEYALVSRGTSSFSDWKNNIQQFFGTSPDLKSAINYANTFVENNPHNEITFVGHSKGGAEAMASALNNNKNAILFNPAPLSLSAELNQAKGLYTGHISEYIVRGDAINLTLNRFARPLNTHDTVVYLPSPHTLSWGKGLFSSFHKSAISNHAMNSVMNALMCK